MISFISSITLLNQDHDADGRARIERGGEGLSRPARDTAWTYLWNFHIWAIFTSVLFWVLRMILCGDKGFMTKAGKPCGYRIGEDAACCPHHAEDKSFAREFQQRGVYARDELRLPDIIETNGFQTLADLKATLSQVANEIATNKKVDLKRMDGLVRVCGVVGTVLQVEKIDELNDTLRRAEGHGPALVILEGLKQGRTRRLPGVVERTVKEVAS